VRLAVNAQHLAIGIDHRERVVVRIVGPLEEAQRQHYAELGRERLETRNDRITRHWTRELEVRGPMVLAEIGRLKKLLQ
jgi:hypothetical protein